MKGGISDFVGDMIWVINLSEDGFFECNGDVFLVLFEFFCCFFESYF